ncbi:Predicted 5' DNA nuclease, flap endonuclease-1-like, helix-3-turn-helix (H3TH) domain [Paracoccus isoporae]|uniref:Predicted 5' DNA nuclease, flap endonuclease-1-like, helix-3-turn-helix (H3TH) domain n=1 Tax=Paracoccus isoporae TaxID=591205 RepID=A0A1G6T0Y7_9RHOB|nr:hypothetical protein [Paracoccus isoporae]SDD22651.1 Predicted 5' DNA nuclease, flap endonuclease-1-like, helix-3-turn-helix (H3TH) domain [Paracoccus isoporae]
MLKNECSRNCWLAAAVVGLLVWIFSGMFFGGFFLGLITLFLLGGMLRWLICDGRGGVAEDAEVLTGRPEHVAHEDEGGLLERAERAVVDASSAIATGAVSAVSKGREALRDARDGEDNREDAAQARTGDDRPDAPRRQDTLDGSRHGDDDDGDGLLERAEDRLERAGDAVKDAMGAVAARGKKALSSLSGDGDADRPAGQSRAPEAGKPDRARAAAFYDPQAGEAASSDTAADAQVSPSGQAAIPAEQAAESTVNAPNPAKTKAPKAEKPAKSGKKKKADKAEKPAKPAKSKKADKAGKADKPAKSAKSGKKKADASAAAPGSATPSSSGPDDLKEIKGVGPQLEKLLHENGVTSFAQIAGWAESDIDRFAELIGRMGGRIRSDDWVAQAKVLAAGGETEFSRRVDKGEVY